MADLGEEAFSSQMKVVATFLRLLEELMRNKQQDLRYGTKTQRRGILGRMKDFVGGIFKKVYDGTFGRLSRNGKDYGQLDLNDPAVAKLFADTMKQMGMDAMHEDIIENGPVGGVSSGEKPCHEHTRLSDKAETTKSACSKIAESEQRERGIEKPTQIEAK